MSLSHEVIIIGGGPGGSTLGSLLAKKGVDVAIIEREVYPRFHIGESLLPATMPLYKEIGFYETLKSGKYIDKYGARFVDFKSQDEVYFGFRDGFNPDIPNAFEVERSQFDRDILNHASLCGAKVYQPARVKSAQCTKTQATLQTTLGEMTCEYVIDATGRDALFGKQNKLRTAHPDLNNVAVFAHYTGVKRNPGLDEGDITIGLLPNRAWTWLIPFKGERTSVGVVCTSSIFKVGSDLEEYLHTMLSMSERVKDMMKDAERCTEISVISNYSHVSETYCGDRWMMAGDAAVFLDPIFSSGVHVSCTSAKLASEVILKCLKDRLSILDEDRGARYKKELDKGVSRFHNLISLFYGDNFVQQMKKTLTLENSRKAFTSAVAGDMWNDNNFLFQKNVL